MSAAAKGKPKKPQPERVTVDANGFVIGIEPVDQEEKSRKRRGRRG